MTQYIEVFPNGWFPLLRITEENMDEAMSHSKMKHLVGTPVYYSDGEKGLRYFPKPDREYKIEEKDQNAEWSVKLAVDDA